MARSLERYRSMRDFDRTPEPKGRRQRAAKVPIFVIQKHDATRLHYDLRLEAAGVLKSWAVPKGVTLDPLTKRLAMRTEDHPRDYAVFEGVIPEGEYGAGPVIVWDYGVYVNQTVARDREVPVERAIEAGHVKFWLHGVKVRGGFALQRTGVENGKERWLLIKKTDEEARSGKPAWNEASVLSGRTLEDGLAALKPERGRSIVAPRRRRP